MNFTDKDLKIVRVNNIYDFDFTGELGARFAGRDFLIPAGDSLLVPLSVGEHLAKHLAQAKLIKDSEGRVAQPGDDLKQLWSDSTIAKMMAEIITDERTEPKKAVKSADDLMEEKIKELNNIKDEGEEEVVDTPATPSEEESTSEEVKEEPVKIVYKDKAQVIAELKKKNITFDPFSTKAVLEELLK